MSKNWAADIAAMHNHYGVHDATKDFTVEKWWKFVEFRVKFLEEELTELKEAAANKDAEEVVDALTDMNVVSISTLDLLLVDAGKAWDAVHKTNMNKAVGIKESRPNPLGLPDLIKPDDWVGPSHDDNHGVLGVENDT